MATQKQKQWSVLAMNTTAFTVCFAVWTMFSIIGIQIKAELGLSESQFGLLIATPILSGALARLPLGLLTDYFGGRLIFSILMIVVAAASYGLSFATLYWHYLIAGLCVGLAGGSFAVGIAYTSAWFEKERQGFVMGIFGAGNVGAALTNLAAPLILLAYGWRMVPQVYAVAIALMAVIFLFFTYDDQVHFKTKAIMKQTPLSERLKPLRELRVWRFSLYYFVVFGGYVALALWLPSYIVNEYNLSITTASFITMAFTLPGALVRVLGGWLSDEYGARSVNWAVFWVCIVSLFFLSYPPTSMTIHGIDRDINLSFSMNIWAFGLLIFIVGVAMGFGKASIYRMIHDYYPEHMGVVGGFVGTVGALGGFVLPVIFGLAADLTGIRSSCFMFLYGLLGACMFWMHYAIKTEEHLERIRHAAKSNFLME